MESPTDLGVTNMSPSAPNNIVFCIVFVSPFSWPDGFMLFYTTTNGEYYVLCSLWPTLSSMMNVRENLFCRDVVMYNCFAPCFLSFARVGNNLCSVSLAKWIYRAQCTSGMNGEKVTQSFLGFCTDSKWKRARERELVVDHITKQNEKFRQSGPDSHRKFCPDKSFLLGFCFSTSSSSNRATVQ